MISGARCCSSNATPEAVRNFKTPSRPSALGQVTSAQSLPMIVPHSAFRRASIPPSRRATIGAASLETATPIARMPSHRSPSAGLPVRLTTPTDACCCRLIAPMLPFSSAILPASQAPEPTALLAWYDRHRRVLSWRSPPGVRPEPYRVWLSEIMLQQTTVATVGPYFDRFVARWPNIVALAAASLDEVLQLWQGLGYYARARNLHACARAVVERHGGLFPDEIAALRALPGIGHYTAAAIAAIAFDRREAAIDGNVERVIARLFAVREPLPAVKHHLAALAAALVPQQRAGDFAQALMDLGATICTPRRPRCVLCPWRACCTAAALGAAEELPAKPAKPERP